MRSRGSVEFSRLAGTARDWSDRLGYSVQSVVAWRTGDRRPSSAVMQKIEDMGGPKIEAWDEPVAARPARAPRAAGEVPSEATADDTAGEAARLLGHIRDLQAELSDPEAEDVGMDLPKRIRAVDQLAGAITKLGAITGVKLTERAILASPLWGVLLERVLAALEPWPEAIRAVGAALMPEEKDPKA